MEPPSACTRSLSQSINWTNCIVCPKKSHKKDRKLHRIESTERNEKLQNAAQRRNDLQMICRILNEDLLQKVQFIMLHAYHRILAKRTYKQKRKVKTKFLQCINRRLISLLLRFIKI